MVVTRNVQSSAAVNPGAPSATFSITDLALVATLTRSLGDANRLLSEDEIVYSNNQLTFTASRGNWLSSPPSQVWIDGDLQPTSAYTVPGDGTVVFHTVVDPMSTVTVTYWFNFFTATDLYDFVSVGLSAIEGSLGATGMLVDTRLPRSIKDPILKVAHILALQALLTGTLDNYLWKTGGLEGRTVDKSKVAANFTNAIKMYTESVEISLAWLRPQFLAEGESMVLNIDRNQPPSKFSGFNVGDALHDIN